MKRYGMISAVVVAGALAAAACSNDATAPAAPRAPSLAAAADAGEYLVLFKGNKVPADFASQVQAAGGSVTFTHSGVGLAGVAGLDAAGAARIAALSGVQQVAADAGFTVEDAKSVAEVDAGELASDVANSQANPTTASRYVWQWNMRLIHANTAWAAGKLGSASITVAIIDSGLDYDINDLNGLVDLSRSTSLVPSDNALAATYFPTRNPVTDFNGHGTNVASQVSSKAVALAGVTSRTTLIGVKVLDRLGNGNVGRSLNGVLWAADHGANIANMSLGGGFLKAGGNGQLVAIINRVINYANRQGMLIVVSAGNEGADMDHDSSAVNTYCTAIHVVCVSAVGPERATASGDNVSYYTNFGRSAVTVAAPGGNADAAHAFAASAWPWGTDIASWVWSYCPKNRIAGLTMAGVPVLTACAAGNRLSGFIGTSQASPHVAGLAALLMAETGSTNPAFIKNRLVSSALDLGETGTDPFYGRGRIDVASALGL